MAYRYLQLNDEKDLVIGESILNDIIDHPLMILDEDRRGKRGQRYDETTDTFEDINYVTYDIANYTLSNSTEDLEAIRPEMYYTSPDTLTLRAECLFNGNIDANLNLPLSKTPVVRYASGFPTNDEFYAELSIEKGILTGVINITKSGDWRIEDGRINTALEVFGIPWRVKFEDIHLIV